MKYVIVTYGTKDSKKARTVDPVRYDSRDEAEDVIADRAEIGDPAAEQGRMVVEEETHDFPARLRALREKAGISQAELARRAGVSQSRVSEWESGTAEPNLSGVVAVARALKVCPAKLIN